MPRIIKMEARQLHGGVWMVTLTIPTKAGPMVLHARAEASKVSGAFERNGSLVGFGFGDLVKAASHLARRVASSGVVHAASQLLKNPLVAAIIPAPALAAINMAAKSIRALNGATQGSAEAKAALRAAFARAQSDPSLAAALRAAQEATGIRATGAPALPAPSQSSALAFPAQCACGR